jgi:cytoskeletal protein RodZ
MVRFWTRAAVVVLLAVTGFLSAVLLAGCGSGGTAGSGTRSGTLANRTTRTETIAASPTTSTDTVEAAPPLQTQTRVAATVTETKPVITATTTTLTETRPSLTVNTSTTVVTVAPPPATTTASEETGKNTPTWVWIVVLAFAGTVIGLIVALIRRHPSELPPQERRRILDGAVASWTGAGWMIESQSDNTAILVRGGERTQIVVDGAGHVTSAPFGPPHAPS